MDDDRNRDARQPRAEQDGMKQRQSVPLEMSVAEWKGGEVAEEWSE
jgi:hypothetical protein